ncbi:MAG TPA: thioredoxin family protein [Candidatus Sulfotelmatobacter sp.]|nr:thioredoxin family protein [Candidatus Sulfotelmatobacter sp.]
MIVAIALSAGLPALADEKIPVLKAGSETYSNVVVTSVSTTDVYFISSSGMGNVKLKDLSPEMQKHFNFDPVIAKAVEQTQADDKLKYHEELLHQPVVKPPDMSRDSLPVAVASHAGWSEDFAGAFQQAQSDNKNVLLAFTGSDWSPGCIRFDHDVLATSKFSDYAARRLELVKVDFPRNSPQSDVQHQMNITLAKQCHVDAFPTYILLNPAGKELGQQVGYLNGGPDAFVAELEKFSGR